MLTFGRGGLLPALKLPSERDLLGREHVLTARILVEVIVYVVLPGGLSGWPVKLPADAARAGYAITEAVALYHLDEPKLGASWAIFRGDEQLHEGSPLVADETLELRAASA